MRKCILIMIFFLFANGLYAQGIDNAELNRLTTAYLENTLRRFLNRRDLAVTEISTTTDWGKSSNDANLSYFLVEGRFRNLPVDGRVHSGRLTYSIVVRRPSSTRGRPEIREEDQKDRIILLVDDLLSDELRDSMVINYINQTYNRPLDISIKRSRLEIYPNEIYSFVSAIVNNNTIKYFRFVFGIEDPVYRSYDRIEIRRMEWVQKRADEIFSCPFPDQRQIRTDARDSLYAFFSNDYRRRTGKNIIDFEFTSGISSNSITKIELVEATDGLIKLFIEFQYDYGRLFSYSRYLTKAIINYQYDEQENKWNYINILVDEYVAL